MTSVSTAPADNKHDLNDLPDKAVALAAEILKSSRQNESPADRKNSSTMARMMQDEPGKKFTIAMADQVLRVKKPQRASDRLASLIREYGVPKYFRGLDRIQLWLGNAMASAFPNFVMPLIKSQVRQESAHVIISAEPDSFERYLSQRREYQVRVNFNQLGEAVLGDHEADRRLQAYLDRLDRGDIDYVSVKLSSIVSQISLTGYDQTLETIRERLRLVYRAAIKGGGTTPKFVNLDMEEYRDLHLTVDIFQSVLDEPEFESLEAGIVLQAYLPDSYNVLQSLTAWARQRHDRTGAGIKIRLVKGANLAMEQVEASLRGWEQAPYYNKPDVDANYKRMLEFATRPENANVVQVGVASHNLFDVAYAMLVRQRRGVEPRVEFEMLEGMANAQALEVRERTGDLIVYTPVCADEDFESAVAYLVRRLDENTAPGSFLGALFGLEEGSPQWNEQRDAFLNACQRASDPALPSGPNRRQNRLTEQIMPKAAEQAFENEPDTDFSLPENRQWCQQIQAEWEHAKPGPVPIQFGGKEVTDGRLTGVGHDPSRAGYEAYRFAQGTAEDLEVALQTAVQAVPEWEAMGVEGRGEILRQVAAVMGQQRGESIGVMMLDAGKAIMEADVEVSEAIDFANYYAESLTHVEWHDGSQMRARGVVAVTPPWNFPYAIPAGGVLAALAAGNTVILKPARESVLTAWQLATQLWEAGVPRKVLQFMPLIDGATGKRLVTDPRVAAVILTGSYFTASMFQEWRPDLPLFAETSGKNCMIITASADLDLAIKDLVRGAFGHAGQKCSATSLALIEKEVYDDQRFIAQLKDAAESLIVGGSWNPSAVVTPVIRQPDEYLERGLKQLEPGEKWLIEPEMVDNNPCLWKPGIRLNVQPGGWYHQTECFGPVLGLIRVDSLEQGIEIQNSSEFGLTGGLHSLDPQEIQVWRDKVQVGNAYINRGTTGAIVRRQPFGGWKDSCVGPGAKAGGPNYVAAFCEWSETSLPEQQSAPAANVAALLEISERLGLDDDAMRELTAAAGSYAHWWQREFSIEHDPSRVHGETNHFRYVRRPWHVLRIDDVQSKNALRTAVKVAAACLTTGTNLCISVPATALWCDELDRRAGIEIVQESVGSLASRLAPLKNGTLRFAGEYDIHQFAPSQIGNVPIAPARVLSNGRIELLNYLREQSISETVHRYGNII